MKHENREPRLFPPEGVLNTPAAVKILWDTFWLSQGRDSIQEDLFEQIKFRRPQWRLLPAYYTAIERSFLQTVYKTFGKPEEDRAERHKTVDPGDYEGSTTEMLDSLYKVLSQRVKPFTREELQTSNNLLTIFINMTNRDYEVLTGTGRVRAPTDSDDPAPEKDRWLSHTTHYVLEGKMVGIPPLDEMFVDMRRRFLPVLFPTLFPRMKPSTGELPLADIDQLLFYHSFMIHLLHHPKSRIPVQYVQTLPENALQTFVEDLIEEEKNLPPAGTIHSQAVLLLRERLEKMLRQV